MKSTAHFKGHPLHPIFVTFPIAFFIGTLVFDILWLVNGRNDFAITARFLEIAGIVSGLLAAIPGIIDFIFTVPPKSSAKKRATRHGLTNVSMIIIFSIALFLRQRQASPFLITGLEAIGVILLTFAGWMGGTLVYRNQIGVNPRYAQAGKWKEVYLDANHGKIEVAAEDELKINQMKLLHINNSRIVLCRTESGYAAFNDHCTHRGGSLAGGAMICGIVQCPWHGSQFDVKTGMVQSGPAKENVNIYKVGEEGGKVFLVWQ